MRRTSLTRFPYCFRMQQPLQRSVEFCVIAPPLPEKKKKLDHLQQIVSGADYGFVSAYSKNLDCRLYQATSLTAVSFVSTIAAKYIIRTLIPSHSGARGSGQKYRHTLYQFDVDTQCSSSQDHSKHHRLKNSPVYHDPPRCVTMHTHNPCTHLLQCMQSLQYWWFVTNKQALSALCDQDPTAQ